MSRYPLCPAGCGMKFITKEHAERHADTEHPDWRIPKSKGWRTPYGFIDFREPVTYEKACEVMKSMHEKLTTETNNGKSTDAVL